MEEGPRTPVGFADVWADLLVHFPHGVLTSSRKAESTFSGCKLQEVHSCLFIVPRPRLKPDVLFTFSFVFSLFSTALRQTGNVVCVHACLCVCVAKAFMHNMLKVSVVMFDQDIHL